MSPRGGLRIPGPGRKLGRPREALTLQMLADRAGVSKSTIWRLLRPARKVETLTGLVKQLPDGQGKELLFEFHAAVERIADAGPRQQAMVKAMIQALRTVTEADAADLGRA